MAITFDDSKLEGPFFETTLNQVGFPVKSFCKGNSVFFCAGTGYGKLIIFQCIFSIVDILSDQVVRASTIAS